MSRAWLVAVALVAGANFGWQLGSSSLFVDEVLSVQHSLPALGEIPGVVEATESTPWTYFVFLHEWIGRGGSQADWFVRLPSAIAGVALALATGWLGMLVGGRRVGVTAGMLVALSPLVLQYAQQARVYVFAMLAGTIAVAAALEAVRRERRRSAWLGLALAASATCVWLHYTGAFVAVPLAVWMATRTELSVRERLLFVGVETVALMALVPLLFAQYRNAPEGGLVGVADLTWSNLTLVAGAPLVGRTAVQAGALEVAAAAVTLAGVAAIARRAPGSASRLVVALAIAAPAAIALMGLAGRDVLITRYVAVAAPFAIVATAAAATRPRRPMALAALAACFAVALVGLARSHRSSGFYLDAAAVIERVRQDRQLDDALITPGGPGSDVPLLYYAARRLRPPLEHVPASDPVAVGRLAAQRRRVWLVLELPRGNIDRDAVVANVSAALRPLRRRVVASWTFPAIAPVALILTAPDGRLRQESRVAGHRMD